MEKEAKISQTGPLKQPFRRVVTASVVPYSKQLSNKGGKVAERERERERESICVCWREREIESEDANSDRNKFRDRQR